jgi:tripartite-type tricarboxylate transporter receptor subunit TctC
MTIMSRSFFKALAAALLLVACADSPAVAETEWPQSIVELIVPAAAGGTADILARRVVVALERETKQKFVVINRPGGGNLIGTRVVVSSRPDGYRLLVHSLGGHVIPTKETQDALDPARDFSHLAYIGGIPSALLVHPSVPASDVNSLLAYGRSQPNGVNWASPGLGTHGYVLGELFREATSMKMTHVPYKGAGQALGDVVANQVPVGFMTLSATKGAIDSGWLRPLAHSGERRTVSMTDVPTFAEIGYPKLTGLTWFGVSGPPNMPVPLKEAINETFNRAVATQEVKEFMAQNSFESGPMTWSEFTDYFIAQVKLMTPYVQQAQ